MNPTGVLEIPEKDEGNGLVKCTEKEVTEKGRGIATENGPENVREKGLEKDQEKEKEKEKDQEKNLEIGQEKGH
jgi:hypothetical protein